MALFLPELNALFIHIPKCGGTWVKETLAASGIKCEPARGPGAHGLPMSYDHPGARKFCFVRHPWPWYESVWRGLHTSWPDRREVAPLHREKTWSPIRFSTYLLSARTFPGFIQAVIEEQPAFCSRMFEWYIGPPGFPLVDYVGCCEDAAHDLQTILGWLGWRGILASVPEANCGSGPRPLWGMGQVDKVEDMEFAIGRWYERGGPFKVTTDA